MIRKYPQGSFKRWPTGSWSSLETISDQWIFSSLGAFKFKSHFV